MKRRRAMKLFMLALVMLFVAGLAGNVGAAAPREPEEIWQELLKLPSDERQKRLVAGAKAEGKAIVYGNISADHLQKLRIDFDKRYGAKLDAYPPSAKPVPNLLITEPPTPNL